MFHPEAAEALSRYLQAVVSMADVQSRHETFHFTVAKSWKKNQQANQSFNETGKLLQ